MTSKSKIGVEPAFAGVTSLPSKAKNQVIVTLEKNQYDKESNPIDPRVFGRGTFNLMIGSRFTGKTTLLSYLIKTFYLKRGVFDAIMILTPSALDAAWNNIRNRKKVTIMSKCTNELLFDLLEGQEERLKAGERKHILLVVDDYATQCRSLKALEVLAIRARHALITVICTAQYSRLLTPTMRQQAQGVVLFKTSDMELRNLGNEGLRALVDTNSFVEWVKIHTEQPRSYVYINLRDPNRTFNIGFSEPG